MTAQRLILVLVFIIVVIASVTELIFNGFSWKTILLLLSTILLVIFLWFRPENKQ